MRLESKVTIFSTPERVWNFLGDISNIPKWDFGVARAVATTNLSRGLGFEFDTFAPAGVADGQKNGRMSYRIAEIGPNHCTIQLTNSTGNARFFKTAQWHFHVEPATEGTVLTCTANFAFRFRYIILTPIFYALRKAIDQDLLNLKRVLEENSSALSDGGEPATSKSPSGFASITFRDLARLTNRAGGRSRGMTKITRVVARMLKNNMQIDNQSAKPSFSGSCSQK